MAQGNGSQQGISTIRFEGTFAHFMLQKKNWLLLFAIVAAISSVGLVLLGKWTYEGAPPLTNFVSATGETVINKEQIYDGKELFHVRGLMSWGSYFGDGSERGPDFTADALHRTRLAMTEFYENETNLDRDSIEARVKRELHENGWDKGANVIRINDAQVYALGVL